MMTMDQQWISAHADAGERKDSGNPGRSRPPEGMNRIGRPGRVVRHFDQRRALHPAAIGRLSKLVINDIQRPDSPPKMSI